MEITLNEKEGVMAGSYTLKLHRMSVEPICFQTD